VGDSEQDKREAGETIRILGVCLQQLTLYGSAHGVAKKAVKRCYERVCEILDRDEELVLSTCEGSPIVNGEIVSLSSAHAHTVADTLIDRDIGTFTLTRGITADEFAALTEVLTAQPQDLHELGGFGSALKALAISTVQASASTFARVGGEVTEGGAGPGGGEAGEGAGTVDEAAILAFLAGQGGAAPSAAETMHGVAADPKKLAGMIAGAAEESHASVEFRNGRSLAALAVGCLTRAFSLLRRDPSATTLKGKRKLVKTLSSIQEELLSWLREKQGEVSDDDETALAESVDSMHDELEIQTLVRDYVKKRGAIEANEARILRYMKSKGMESEGLTDLEQGLLSSGLAVGAWQELLAKSGAVGESDGGAGAVGRLAGLLERLQEKAGEGATPEGDDTVRNVLQGVEKELAKVVQHTERKIMKLLDDVREDDARASDSKNPKPPKMSRRKLLETLAEIVQELRQPLTVVTCVLDSVGTGSFGSLTPQQTELLTTAAAGGVRLTRLVDGLAELSGYPSTLAPDKELQAALYG